MLLEMPPRGHGQPLPDIPSLVKSASQLSPRSAEIGKALDKQSVTQQTNSITDCIPANTKPGNGIDVRNVQFEFRVANYIILFLIKFRYYIFG